MMVLTADAPRRAQQDWGYLRGRTRFSDAALAPYLARYLAGGVSLSALSQEYGGDYALFTMRLRSLAERLGAAAQYQLAGSATHHRTKTPDPRYADATLERLLVRYLAGGQTLQALAEALGLAPEVFRQRMRRLAFRTGRGEAYRRVRPQGRGQPRQHPGENYLPVCNDYTGSKRAICAALRAGPRTTAEVRHALTEALRYRMVRERLLRLETEGRVQRSLGPDGVTRWALAEVDG